jgi:hypothetical protein
VGGKRSSKYLLMMIAYFAKKYKLKTTGAHKFILILKQVAKA